MRKQNTIHIYLGWTTLMLTTLAVAATLCACTKTLTREIRTARRADEFAAMEDRVQKIRSRENGADLRNP